MDEILKMLSEDGFLNDFQESVNKASVISQYDEKQTASAFKQCLKTHLLVEDDGKLLNQLVEYAINEVSKSATIKPQKCDMKKSDLVTEILINILKGRK